MLTLSLFFYIHLFSGKELSSYYYLQEREEVLMPVGTVEGGSKEI
ncbi:hypothetical protein P5757_11665 [Bacillus tropicus]|nr:hypothetical protein [Bacillus tropicus]MDF9557366.1 hypothetical protein [Bacillus tropicus]MDF9589449.1 hypothetical protein [Bacillus tropicus]MDF9647825.1 hypothetical protein [Bacillus tropicus]